MSGIRTRGKGELEAGVLTILREHGEPIGAGEIQESFTGHVPAYTTILTALDRLVEKGEVVRHAPSPRKVRFMAARSAVEDATDTMLRALSQIDDRKAALLKFAGDLDEDDVEMLRAALTKQRRRP